MIRDVGRNADCPKSISARYALAGFACQHGALGFASRLVSTGRFAGFSTSQLFTRRVARSIISQRFCRISQRFCRVAENIFFISVFLLGF